MGRQLIHPSRYCMYQRWVCFSHLLWHVLDFMHHLCSIRKSLPKHNTDKG